MSVVSSGPIETVAEQLRAYVDVGVEQFVVRFTATDQYDQLHRFHNVIQST